MPRTRKLITPKPLPGPQGGRRASDYTMALEQFVEAKCDSAVVNIDKKPATVALGLTKAIKADKAFSGVKVARRGEEVYLVKA